MKYAALLLTVVSLLLLGWALTGITSLMGGRLPQVRPPIMELKPLSDKDVQEQAATLLALQTINGLKARDQSVNHRLGQTLVELPVPGSPGSEVIPLPERQLTLLAHTADESVAVVDGQLVRRGQRLASGGRVSRIREGQIVVAEKAGSQTLAVPLASLRVGTLRAPDAQVPRLGEQVLHLAPSRVPVTGRRHE